ncbi:uncharacterized protein LOC112494061 [Cephus cinctus]|uniref:Uncharacterized protein LOC112494061 n=1 Tax=Cephus cinctus TaxID=211228 RepID=A0AAJ7VZ98_CEPCN|nr:uncharacterized protein LOC112494061 [Cephus cinctus]
MMEEEEEEEEEEEGEESLHNTWDEIMSIASAASDRSVYGDDDDDRSTMSSASNERYRFVDPLEVAGYDNHIAPDNARPPQEHDDAEEPVLWVRRNGVYEVADADEAADTLAGRDGAPSAADRSYTHEAEHKCSNKCARCFGKPPCDSASPHCIVASAIVNRREKKSVCQTVRSYPQCLRPLQVTSRKHSCDKVYRSVCRSVNV